MTSPVALDYYAAPGPFTAVGPHNAALRSLPSSVPELLGVVQGLLVHHPESWDYATGHLRETAQILTWLLDTDPRPLTRPRAPARKAIGCSRHFVLVTVAALRAHGVPSRARVGYARYLEPGRHLDHWAAEYWDADRSRWLLADARLDAALRADLGLAFDPADVPRDQFVVAGETWTRCRAGELDWDRCGLPLAEQSGWWGVAGNLIRDVAALSKMEMLPWDIWGAMPWPEDASGSVFEGFDAIAGALADPDTADLTRTIYPDESFRVPELVFNFIHQNEERVFGAATPD